MKDNFKKDEQLSYNFWYSELVRTEHRQFLEKNWIEGLQYVNNARKLCFDILQPIRDYYGKPLVSHSAFRCRELNKAVKGSPKSQHILFEACDFHIVGEKLEDVWEWIWKKSGLMFGQLILEGWTVGHPSWIHISLCGNRPPDKCQEVWTFSGGKYSRIA
ncbi:MAG: D-Ala-D-Ala carboxypeptidase family metallohydrolase [bacterium]